MIFHGLLCLCAILVAVNSINNNGIIGEDDVSGNKFIDEYFTQNIESVSLVTHSVRLSQNILDLNPVPLYVKPEIDNYLVINREFHDIAKKFPKDGMYVNFAQDPNKASSIFTAQNAYVPGNSLINNGFKDNEYVELLFQNIFSGISEILQVVYNHYEPYEYKIMNEWMQKYKDGAFLSPHNHIKPNAGASHERVGKRLLTFAIAYYVDDGNPDTSFTYSGCITFFNANKLMHVRPTNGTLLIWEDYLTHLVNPFYSKNKGERFTYSINIIVYY